MTDKMKSFVKGILLGLVGHPLPQGKEPVAYLYNGVRLPKLPEWDRVAYPYAAIVTWQFTENYLPVYRYRVIASATPLWREDWISTEDGTTRYSSGVILTYPGVYFKGGLVDGESEAWGEAVDYKQQRSIPGSLVWADHDVIIDLCDAEGVHTTDGIHMEASEPVPVYEKE